MPGKGIKGGPPVYDRKGKVGIFKAVVTSVDPVTWTMSVRGENNEFFEGLPIQSKGLGAEGQGEYELPETNSVVWMMRPSTAVDPFMFMSAALPKQTDEGDDEEDPNDYRMNRPVLNEGDKMISGRDGNFIVVRRGGVIEIGASQVAQRFYIPVQNIIRDFCKSYEMITAGGTMSFKSRTDDETHGEGATPIEFNLQIKEFAEEEPIIECALGRVEDEDDLRVSGGSTGDIVAKLVINNAFRYLVDKEGNVDSYTHGASLHSHNGPSTNYYQASFFQRVRGLLLGNYGNRVITTLGTDAQDIRGSRTVTVGGDETKTVEGNVTRTTGNVSEEIKGSLQRNIAGSQQDQINGNLEQVVAGATSLQVADDASQVVVGKREEFVINSQVSDVGYLLYVAAGEINIHDVLGNVVLSAGPTPNTALASIKLEPLGNIVLKNITGTASVEINKTGISISTPSGVIEIDNVGTVQLGPPFRFGVVTTGTHPVDYVTGLPILGSSSVQAGGGATIAGVEPASTFISSEL